MRPNLVYTEPIAAAVQEWLDGEIDLSVPTSRGGDMEGTGQGSNFKTDRWYGPSRVLAERAGLPPDTLISILDRRRKTMDFNYADRLLCACGLQHLWWTKLKWYYKRVRLVDREAA